MKIKKQNYLGKLSSRINTKNLNIQNNSKFYNENNHMIVSYLITKVYFYCKT